MHLKETLYDWGGLNTTLFYAINRIHSPLLDSFMMVGTKLGNYKLFPAYIIIIAAVMYAQSMRWKAQSPAQYAHYKALCIETLLVLCAAYAFSCIWVPLLKNGFHFMRPFARLPEGTVHITDAVRQAENPNASFPSGHSEFVMLLVAGVWPMLKGYGKALGIAFILWVGVSRLSLGVHFPADVIYSLLLSLCAVILLRSVVRKVFSRITGNIK